MRLCSFFKKKKSNSVAAALASANICFPYRKTSAVQQKMKTPLVLFQIMSLKREFLLEDRMQAYL